MQICTSLKTDNHASPSPLSFFTGRMPFLLPNQQHQSTEGTITVTVTLLAKNCQVSLQFFYLRHVESIISNNSNNNKAV